MSKTTPNITPFYGFTVFYVRKPLQISHHLWLHRALCQKTTPNITPFYGLTVFYVKNHSKYHTILWLDCILCQKNTPNITLFYGFIVFYVRKPLQISHHFMALPYSMTENHSKYHTILWLHRALCQKTTTNITPFYGLTVYMSKTTPNITPCYGLTVIYVRKPLQISHHFMASPCSMSENHSKYHTILWLHRALCQKTTPNITPFYGFTVFYVRKPLQISHHFMA